MNIILLTVFRITLHFDNQIIDAHSSDSTLFNYILFSICDFNKYKMDFCCCNFAILYKSHNTLRSILVETVAHTFSLHFCKQCRHLVLSYQAHTFVSLCVQEDDSHVAFHGIIYINLAPLLYPGCEYYPNKSTAGTCNLSRRYPPWSPNLRKRTFLQLNGFEERTKCTPLPSRSCSKRYGDFCFYHAIIQYIFTLSIFKLFLV